MIEYKKHFNKLFWIYSLVRPIHFKTLLDIAKGGGTFGTSVSGVSGVGITGNTQSSNAGPLYTGAITINVAAPPSADPYAFAQSISAAMAARS
jgi:hypothetical protein